MSLYTRQPDDVGAGREIVRRDGVIVADVIPCASGIGLWLHFFTLPGGPLSSRALCRCRDWDSVRDIVKAELN